jgi:hypothetical protein
MVGNPEVTFFADHRTTQTALEDVVGMGDLPADNSK